MPPTSCSPRSTRPRARCSSKASRSRWRCPTPWASSATCRTSWSRLSGHAAGGHRGRPAAARGRRVEPARWTSSAPRSNGCWPRSARRIVPQILVYNKLDALERAAARRCSDWIARDDGMLAPRVFVSAPQGTGLDRLRELIAGVAAGEGLRPPAAPPSEGARSQPAIAGQSDPSAQTIQAPHEPCARHRPPIDQPEPSTRPPGPGLAAPGSPGWSRARCGCAGIAGAWPAATTARPISTSCGATSTASWAACSAARAGPRRDRAPMAAAGRRSSPT